MYGFIYSAIDTFNKFVDLSWIVPDELKVARFIPIYKGEDVIDVPDENMVFYKRQFGFRKNHSTSHAIITLVERVSKALDTGKYVVGVFIYLKRAFDTVDHNILLAKLKQYGMRGNIHSWFKSYLLNRKQYVEYNNF